MPEPAAASLHPEVERWARVAGLFAVNFTGYYAIGLTRDPSRALSLRTPLDDAIPFLPLTQWLYFAVYTTMLYPAFVVRDPGLFRRVTRAYLVVIAVSLACFWLVPVSAIGLRADLSGLGTDTFWEWGVRVNYTLDPPWNLFPSEHLSIAVLAALSAGTARRAWGLCAAPVVAGIAVAICTVKQHYLLDGVAGLALGAGAWAALVRGCPEAALPESQRARGASGPLAFVLFTLAVYAAFYVAYRLGWQPWVG